ncbi:hypothetical protein OUZ56_029892 [Daphnia magna]|uniref:Transposase Tc1-like domain-containing protein n=1 Tax=Daphnia magna TaxID=35525 RepID=A0ABR0B879_9CRUS|nr:hypothetical protein OUZ56_029892 [Daphnia magna]
MLLQAMSVKPITTLQELKAVASIDICEMPIHRGTISRRLKHGIHGKIAAKKEILTQAQKNARLAFATEFVNNDADWRAKVILSDEKTFGSHECGRSFVYRTNGTKFNPNHNRTIAAGDNQFQFGPGFHPMVPGKCIASAAVLRL